jgi:hypothetical protein
MADAEYRAFLAQIDAMLPKWKASLQDIDPEKDERISYSLGKSIVSERDIALMEVGNVRTFVAAQRFKRTVSGELALAGFLEGVFDAMGDEVSLESAVGLRLSDVDKHASELSALIIRIKNDVTARVQLLENGSCP